MIKEDDMHGVCSTRGEIRNTFKMFVGMQERMVHLGIVGYTIFVLYNISNNL
jgi:hypothetical protein